MRELEGDHLESAECKSCKGREKAFCSPSRDLQAPSRDLLAPSRDMLVPLHDLLAFSRDLLASSHKSALRLLNHNRPK